MSKHRRKNTNCPNCQTALIAEDNFCRNCGQENHDLNVPFHHLVGEFIESIFHIDTKMWQTLKVIFTRPGKITSDFVAGKRASYMPPARFYIFCSFVFFLLVNLVADRFIKENASAAKFTDTFMNASFDIGGKTVKMANEDVKFVNGFTNDQIDSVLKKSGIIPNEKMRQSLKVEAHNYVVMIKSFSDYKKVIIQDSVSSKITVIDSAEVQVISKFKDKELLRYLSQKQIFPEEDDFEDLKDDLEEFNGDLSKSNKGEKSDSKGEKFKINGINKKILEASPKNPSRAQIDSILTANNIENTWPRRMVVKQYHRFKNFDFQKDSKQISHAFFKNMSLVMFVLMPVVAIILLLIYFRSRRNYYEYFIFSIHIHSILFLISSVELIVRMLLKSNIQAPILSLLLIYFYFLLSLKHVFKQSWPKSILKFIFLNITYGIIFIVFMGGALIYSLNTLE